jgi:hypothetical protein
LFLVGFFSRFLGFFHNIFLGFLILIILVCGGGEVNPSFVCWGLF